MTSDGERGVSPAGANADSKTAPKGAVGPDCSGEVQHHATPTRPELEDARRTRTAVVVDGFNLHHGLRERFGRRYHWLDLIGLAQRLRPRDDIVGVTYCTAMLETTRTVVGDRRPTLPPSGAQRSEVASPLRVIPVAGLTRSLAEAHGYSSSVVAGSSIVCPAGETATTQSPTEGSSCSRHHW